MVSNTQQDDNDGDENNGTDDSSDNGGQINAITVINGGGEGWNVRNRRGQVSDAANLIGYGRGCFQWQYHVTVTRVRKSGWTILLEMVKGKFCRHIQYGLLKNI